MSQEQQQACRECDEIWREYSHATTNHVKLITERQLAIIRQDATAETRLDAVIRDAEKLRGEAREKLRTHEAGHNWNLRDFAAPVREPA